MKSEIKYELPMFSSNLENEPQIEFKNMNVKITIKGYDENDAICETEIKFISVIGFKQTSPRFTSKLYGAYDKVVEVIDSEWWNELKRLRRGFFFLETQTSIVCIWMDLECINLLHNHWRLKND